MKIRRAFTLLELMAAIAIVLVLACIIMPLLGRIRESSWRVGCMANLRQLSQGYLSYASDNGGYIMSSATVGPALPSATYTAYNPGICGGAPTWTNSYAVPATPAQQDNAIQQGAMFAYVNNLQAYKCPSANNFGNTRSYSIQVVLNGEPGFGANRVFTLENIPRPANTMMFIEEYDDRQQNEGSWVMYHAPTTQWCDYVPDLHKDGCTMSFCDGSVIYYTYTDLRTRYLCHINSAAWSAYGCPAPFFYNPATTPSPDPAKPFVNGFAQMCPPGTYPTTNSDYAFFQANMGY